MKREVILKRHRGRPQHSGNVPGDTHTHTNICSHEKSNLSCIMFIFVELSTISVNFCDSLGSGNSMFLFHLFLFYGSRTSS